MSQTVKIILAAAFCVWNVAVMFLYGIDKYKAKKNKWRISEKTLILLALFLGAPGAFAGMKVFRHKTRHKLFTIGVPVCLVLNMAAICGLIYLTNLKGGTP